MFKDLTIKEFMSTLASGTPVPGGGTVAALAGAAAGSLISMVASLTVGKKGYEDAWNEMAFVRDKAEKLRQELLELMDEDADSYARVMECFRMPKDSEEEKSCRIAAIQKATAGAAMTPLHIAETAYALFDLAESVVKKGNKNAASDGAVAAMMARTCVLSAVSNVRINAASIKDPENKTRLIMQADALAGHAAAREAEILKQITF